MIVDAEHHWCNRSTRRRFGIATAPFRRPGNSPTSFRWITEGRRQIRGSEIAGQTVQDGLDRLLSIVRKPKDVKGFEIGIGWSSNCSGYCRLEARIATTSVEIATAWLTLASCRIIGRPVRAMADRNEATSPLNIVPLGMTEAEWAIILPSQRLDPYLLG